MLFRRLPPFSTVVLSDFAGVGFLVSCSSDFYPVEAVERPWRGSQSCWFLCTLDFDSSSSGFSFWEFCADRWVKIPKRIFSTEVPLQRQYDDTLPTMSVFFKLLRKRWADVCLEAVEFCAQRLLPVGSTQSCRSLQLRESVSSFAPTKPTVFALALEQQQSSSSSSSSSSLHFDQTDFDATASSRPTFSPDLSAVFADFQAALSEQIFASQSDISSRMHKLEQSVCDSLRDQADIFKNLVQGARQEVRTLDDVHTIRFNEFRKNVLTQNASIFQGLADVRQVVDAVNAKVDIMAKRVNDIQKDAEATKEALSHKLLEFQSSAQENHNVIHAQLSELVNYIHRGSADKKGESGSRGLQKPANTQKEGSAVTPSFEQRVQMAQRRIVQTVLDADANRESQEAAERDRERRRKEAKSLKRRRRD
ncbi:NADH dehydrogenase [Dorcoceras hygrometricum]|uniref:NADH dehydrogenase n=1 Tax=Dorcoceras hygrometricum TaxID=472368 RepID=A0A2Z7AYQ8_9LAMI|nr:NADH dehydrogenase [Dorcoceras hygrometricum]